MKKYNYHQLLGEGNPLLRYPQLLEASIDEFSKKRFEDASLNDIIKNANMSKGSLYHHFGDKFGLYLCLMDIIIQKKIAFFSSFIKNSLGSGDFFGTIKTVMKATVEFMFVDERLHHLFNRNMEGGEELTRKIIEYFPYDYSQGFRSLIENAIESGQIHKKYTPEFIVKLLEVLLSNAHKFINRGDDPEKSLETIIRLVEVMQTGIVTKTSGCESEKFSK